MSLILDPLKTIYLDGLMGVMPLPKNERVVGGWIFTIAPRPIRVQHLMSNRSGLIGNKTGMSGVRDSCLPWEFALLYCLHQAATADVFPKFAWEVDSEQYFSDNYPFETYVAQVQALVPDDEPWGRYVLRFKKVALVWLDAIYEVATKGNGALATTGADRVRIQTVLNYWTLHSTDWTGVIQERKDAMKRKQKRTTGYRALSAASGGTQTPPPPPAPL